MRFESQNLVSSCIFLPNFHLKMIHFKFVVAAIWYVGLLNGSWVFILFGVHTGRTVYCTCYGLVRSLPFLGIWLIAHHFALWGISGVFQYQHGVDSAMWRNVRKACCTSQASLHSRQTICPPLKLPWSSSWGESPADGFHQRASCCHTAPCDRGTGGCACRAAREPWRRWRWWRSPSCCPARSCPPDSHNLTHISNS